jgi:hypothetical protein
MTAQGGLSPAQKGKLEATLNGYMAKWQDPKQADTIMKVQKELDETKVVLVRCRVALREVSQRPGSEGTFWLTLPV